MAVFVRPNIARMAGYVPGEQPRDGEAIKLNTNENPYPPSPRVYAALKKAINRSLRLYPEPLADTLRSSAAKVYGVRPENILAGNGSDELLSIVLRTFVGTGDRVAYPVPTYSLYDTLVAIQEGEPVRIPYPADYSLPDALFAEEAAVKFVCNPNSPSGTLAPRDVLERLVRASSGIVVIDEAYVDFAADDRASILSLVRSVPNLIVLRTFSKSFSLAGMRVGLAFASEELVRAMLKVKDSYNLDRLSLVAAVAALEDLAWMKRNVTRIQRTRERLTRGLERLGYRVYPSHANFVLAQRDRPPMRGIYENLKRRNILVRYFDAPGLQDSLRISVGTPREINLLLTGLKQEVRNDEVDRFAARDCGA